MGRVLSQRDKGRVTFVSPARSVPQASAPSTPSLSLERKTVPSAHTNEYMEMHLVSTFTSPRGIETVDRFDLLKGIYFFLLQANYCQTLLLGKRFPR